MSSDDSLNEFVAKKTRKPAIANGSSVNFAENIFINRCKYVSM